MSTERGENANVIVVGIDGSVPSQSALRWAIEQARLTGAVVHAVTAWEFPAMSALGAPYAYDDPAETAGKILSQTIGEVLGTQRPIEIRESVVAGYPGHVLVDAARGAALLVVGSRGHGGVVGSLLGSVSQHCVQHARCPVVVIRGADETG